MAQRGAPPQRQEYSDIPAGFQTYSDIPAGFTSVQQQASPPSLTDMRIEERRQIQAATSPTVQKAKDLRRQQLNYPEAKDTGGTAGTAVGVGGIVEGVKRGLSNVANIPKAVLGDPDTIMGTALRGLGFFGGPRDLSAEFDRNVELGQAQQAKEAAEAKLDGGLALNPNTVRRVINTTSEVGVPAGLVNRAVEGDPVGAAVEGATTAATLLAAGKVAKTTLERAQAARGPIADRLTGSWLKPRMSETDPFDIKAYEYGSDPIKAVQQEGIVANTFTDARSKINQVANSLQQQLRKRLEPNPTTYDAAAIVNRHAEKAINDALAQGNQSLATQIRNFADGQIEAIKAGNGGSSVLPVAKLADLKSELGRTANWSTVDVAEQNLNRLRKDIYRGYDRAIDLADPASAATNARIANLITAEKLLERRFMLTQSSNIMPSTVMGTVNRLLPETATKTRLINAITPEEQLPRTIQVPAGPPALSVLPGGHPTQRDPATGQPVSSYVDPYNLPESGVVGRTAPLTDPALTGVPASKAPDVYGADTLSRAKGVVGKPGSGVDPLTGGLPDPVPVKDPLTGATINRPLHQVLEEVARLKKPDGGTFSMKDVQDYIKGLK